MRRDDFQKRLAALEDALYHGPREEAKAVAFADRLAAVLDAMDATVPGEDSPPPTNRAELLAFVREVRGLPALPDTGATA